MPFQYPPPITVLSISALPISTSYYSSLHQCPSNIHLLLQFSPISALPISTSYYSSLHQCPSNIHLLLQFSPSVPFQSPPLPLHDLEVSGLFHHIRYVSYTPACLVSTHFESVMATHSSLDRYDKLSLSHWYSLCHALLTTHCSHPHLGQRKDLCDITENWLTTNVSVVSLKID